MLKEVESKLAKRRQATSTGGSKPQLVPDSAQAEKNGKARDKVAKNVGLRSRHEVDRAIATVSIVDSLEYRYLVICLTSATKSFESHYSYKIQTSTSYESILKIEE